MASSKGSFPPLLPVLGGEREGGDLRYGWGSRL